MIFLWHLYSAWSIKLQKRKEDEGNLSQQKIETYDLNEWLDWNVAYIPILFAVDTLPFKKRKTTLANLNKWSDLKTNNILSHKKIPLNHNWLVNNSSFYYLIIIFLNFNTWNCNIIIIFKWFLTYLLLFLFIF